jgi:hypothetical protein
VQRPQDLQRAHHSKDAVEAAAAGLGVEVRAGHDRRQQVVPAGPPSEDAAHLVDLDPSPHVVQPGDEQVPRSPVVVAEGEPVHATAGGGADLGHRLKAAAEAHAVHPQPIAWCTHFTSPSERCAAAILPGAPPRGRHQAVRTILPTLPPAAKRS